VRSYIQRTAAALIAGIGLVGVAHAADINVDTDIAVSTTWTAGNVYNLQRQIFVLPGATLTIEAGTVIASSTGVGGSLAVTKGAQIFALGTPKNPIIFTSTSDRATWTNNDPKTGVWREAANEWGNLTIMGDAFVSENATAGNVPTCNANNVAAMEGLVAAFPGDTTVLYGGGNDDDDSGTLRYVSIRYCGKVIGLNNELNGLSLGGIGRGTDINFVEIMNNVDDGIEVWGGTVNLKNISVWNVGDDSFDIDQGWRGKAQFILIVQGYSLSAPQGSGVGDNCFETDGAEDSSWQPVTTATIYNATVIGQPVDGDRGTAWRDNARVQYRNCVFMDIGEEVVGFDNIDGDGANGYGFAGTLSWPATWTTDFSVTSGVNPCPNPGQTYQAQTSGKLAEIKDSVFFRNGHASAYTEATARGVFDAGNNNALIAGSAPADAPIRAIVRGPSVVKGGKVMQPVISLDPRAANEATMSVASAPNDGFFTPVAYRGAFNATQNWVCGWTAADAFGFIDRPDAAIATRDAATNVPNSLTANGLPTIGNAGFALLAQNPTGSCGVAGGASFFAIFTTLVGPATVPFGAFGCGGGPSTILILPPFLPTVLVGLYSGAPTAASLPIPNDGSICGRTFHSQVVFLTGAGNVLGSAVDGTFGE
jgi:hypothetical protein